MKNKKIVFAITVLFLLAESLFVNAALAETPKTLLSVQNSEGQSQNDDSLLYRRHERYLKYQKYQLYLDYKNVKKYKDYKEYAELYQLYKKNPKKYLSYTKYKDYYDNYQKYKEKKKYSVYSKFAFFNNEKNKEYGSPLYKAGYDRYASNLKSAVSSSQTPTSTSTSAPLNYSGNPKIKVGIASYKKSDLEEKSITLKINGSGQIQEMDGSVLGKIPDGTDIRVFFDFSLKEYRVVAVNLDKRTKKPVIVVPDNAELGTCEVDQVGSYRDNIEIYYAGFTKRLWIINELPMEYYVWGMGEAANNSPAEFLKALSVAYRTYGYWKVKNGTAYEKEGFHVTDTGSNQVYGGYGREKNQPNIVAAAKTTAGIIAKYADKIAITPYCSGTDGKTRSWEDVWGSKNYPWCQSVPDPLGVKEGANSLEGNHMVGMSATGAYNYARKEGWDYEKILKYYYQGISLDREW